MLSLVNSDSCYFTTATIVKWKHLLKSDDLKMIVIDSLRFLVSNKRVRVFAFVIMPNHLHIIWEMLHAHKLKNVQRDFLKYTAQCFKFYLLERNDNRLHTFISSLNDRQYQFWQKRSLSINLYSVSVFEQKMVYIHNNPLQRHWHLALCPQDYKFSSASNYYDGKYEWDFVTNFYHD